MVFQVQRTWRTFPTTGLVDGSGNGGCEWKSKCAIYTHKFGKGCTILVFKIVYTGKKQDHSDQQKIFTTYKDGDHK